jgi:formylglycine-generating enzyme required for sulfatase activity
MLLLLFSATSRAQQTVSDSTGQQYRLIEANHFEMGAKRPEQFRIDHSDYNPAGDDQPIHPVILTSPFYIATSEVTRGQFKSFLAETGYEPTAVRNGNGIVGWDPVDNDRGQVKSSFRADPKFSWKNPGFAQTDSHPVVGVSFEDATAYCDWLSNQEGVRYRLPTEAEWECACRAGTDSYFSFGDAYRGLIHRHANVGNVELERVSPGRVLLQWLVDIESDPDDGFAFTSPVASYLPNRWGLHDMHGNVWEWCQDRYLDTYYQQFKRDRHRQVRQRAIDPVCDDRWNQHGDWRVIRGGSWFVSPIQCRSGVRTMFEQHDAACYLGFRVVREPPAEVVTKSRQQFQRSQAALEAVGASARAIYEERDGNLKFEFSCDQLSPQLFDRLAEMDYAVELSLNQPGELTAEMIEQISRIKTLTGLRISVGGREIESKDFAPLARHPELAVLQITGTVDLDDGLLDHFRDAEHLQSINLQGSRITDAGLRRLPALTKLQTLHLAGTQSTGEVLAHFSQSPLREVSFANLTDEGAEKLVAFSSLVAINARSSPLGRSGLQAIASLRQLQSLQLEQCENLTDQDFQLLSRLPQLDRLDLAGTQAGDLAAGSLGGLLHLRDLRIGSDALTDAGMRSLCEVVSLQALAITEQANGITDAGFTDFWRLVNLRTLEVYPQFTMSQGWATVAELPQLQRLTIRNRTLSDNAVRPIAMIANLKELTLGDWRPDGPESLTDRGLLELAAAKTLTKVNLTKAGTKVTDDGVSQLKQRRPDLDVNIR